MKFAYLIMAHKWDNTLKSQLALLDDSRNDIFIRVDKKCNNFPFQEVNNLLKKSKCFFPKRIKATWGGYSLVAAELSLLETASKTGKYDYYHLLSGQNLPLKSQDQMHEFFKEHRGKEFLRFYNEHFDNESRVNFYWFLQDQCGRGNTLLTFPMKMLQKALIVIQQLLHVKRGRKIKFQKGSQWFSITDEFARYLLSKKDWIYKNFRFSFCPDEVFMQTILLNSPYLNNLYWKNFDNDMRAIMRLIQWEDKGPHTFTMNDKDLIDNTDMLWGRKFDVTRDAEIVRYLLNKYSYQCKDDKGA